MDLSVVIPCWNGVEDTRACVLSLREQTGLNSLLGPAGFEVVIVDNGSEDETGALDQWVGGLPPLPDGRSVRLRMVRLPTNQGFAAGINAGVAAASGRRLLLLNNDTLAAPHCVATLLETLESDPAIGMVAPVSNHVKGPARIEVGHVGETPEGRSQLEAALRAEVGSTIQDVPDLSGLCLLLRTSTFERIGRFDERFGLGNYEDDDYSLRARMLGLRLVIARSAFLHHHGHRTFSALGSDYRKELEIRRDLFSAKWCDHPVGTAWLAHSCGDTHLAGARADAALQCAPAWPDGWRYRGRSALERGEFAEAESLLLAYLRRCPRDPRGWTDLVTATWRAGRKVEAINRLGEAQRTCHFDPEAAADLWLKLGNLHLEDGLHQNALEAFDHALSSCRQDPELLNGKGVALLELGRVEEAIEALTLAAQPDGAPDWASAEELNPGTSPAVGPSGHARAQTNLGICHWRLGDATAALRWFERAVATDPTDAVAQANLAAARQAVAVPG